MEYILYTVLHIVLYATLSFSLCGYMYLITWHDCDQVSGCSFISFVMPSFATVCALLFAWAMGLVAPIEKRIIALICDTVIFMMSGFLTGFLSIKKYRDEDCAPEYATFFAVNGYSILILIGSAAFMLFS